MAQPIKLTALNEREKEVLRKAEFCLRLKGDYWWTDGQFQRIYREWLDETNCEYVEGGFDQFRLAVSQLQKKGWSSKMEKVL